VRSEFVECDGGAYLDEIGGGVECLSPKGWWHVCLNQKGVDDIFESAYGEFSFAILLRRVGT
jgi:hypothetical protein